MLVFWINKIAFFQQIVLIKDALNGIYDHLCFGGYPWVGKVNTEFRALLCVHSQAVEEEDKMTPEQLAIKNVGKQVRRL